MLVCGLSWQPLVSVSDCARDILVSVFGILQDFFALWRLVVMRCMLSSRSPAYLNGTRCRSQNRFSQPSEPLGSFREYIPGPASCDRVVYASVLNGAWQRESRETSGSNINKKKSCNYSFKISYRQRVEILSTLKDSKSLKDQISRETFGNPSDTYRGVSMNP